MRGDAFRTYRDEAIVLRRVSTGETDRVVTLFTRGRGKLAAIAKGARGPRSRLGGATEPFSHSDVLLALGQSLDVLTQAEVRNAFPGIRKDLDRIAYASYFLEIADLGLEERQPAPGLWLRLATSLAALEFAPAPDVLARHFELHGLAELGYEPALHECALDQAPIRPAGAGFHPTRGGLICAGCARGTAGAVSVSTATVRALQQLATEPLAWAVRAELLPTVRRELARCLIPFVRYHLDAPLKSLEMVEDLSVLR